MSGLSMRYSLSLSLSVCLSVSLSLCLSGPLSLFLSPRRCTHLGLDVFLFRKYLAGWLLACRLSAPFKDGFIKKSLASSLTRQGQKKI